MLVTVDTLLNKKSIMYKLFSNVIFVRKKYMSNNLEKYQESFIEAFELTDKNTLNDLETCFFETFDKRGIMRI